MPTRAQLTGSVLPETLPDDTLCLRLEVPNDRLLIAAVRGALMELTYYWHWERRDTGDTMASDVSRLFRDLILQTLVISENCSVVDCDEIRACIEDQDPPPQRTSAEQTAQDLLAQLPLSGTCNDADKDMIFGFVTQFVDFLNDAVTDFFQIVEVLTNQLELAAESLDNIPLLGSLPALIADYVVWMQDTLAENYLAAWDSDERDFLRCGLFCAAVNNDCTLTLDDITLWFSEQLLTEIVSLDPADFIVWQLSLGSVLPDRTLILTAFSMACWALQWGSEFLGVGNANRMIKIMAGMSNDPDPDWSIICDPCAQTWCYRFDFTDGEYHDWTRRINAGLPDGGIFDPEGIRSARQTINTLHSIWLESHTGALPTLQTVEISYTSPYPLLALEVRTSGDLSTAFVISSGWASGTQTRVITDSRWSDWDDYQLYLYSGSQPVNSHFYITSITLKGTGPLPAGLTGGIEC